MKTARQQADEIRQKRAEYADFREKLVGIVKDDRTEAEMQLAAIATIIEIDKSQF